MLWLRRVIAHIRTTMVGAMQTPLVGLALPERIVPIGNSSFASDTLHQHRPVHTQQSQNKEAARSTKSASKRGSAKTTASTTKASIAAGSKSAAPASQRRQPVKQAAKHAKAVVQSTLPEQSFPREQALAQTPTDSLSGVRGKLKAIASLTHQPVSPAAKASRSRVQHTKQDASSATESALVQTPMVNQSGNRGKSKTVASKTPQPALLDRKHAPKAVKQTKAAAKRITAKAPAKTHTANPYGERGR